jgi:hypothetical protein
MPIFVDNNDRVVRRRFIVDSVLRLQLLTLEE